MSINILKREVRKVHTVDLGYSYIQFEREGKIALITRNSTIINFLKKYEQNYMLYGVPYEFDKLSNNNYYPKLAILPIPKEGETILSSTMLKSKKYIVHLKSEFKYNTYKLKIQSINIGKGEKIDALLAY